MHDTPNGLLSYLGFLGQGQQRHTRFVAYAYLADLFFGEVRAVMPFAFTGPPFEIPISIISCDVPKEKMALEVAADRIVAMMQNGLWIRVDAMAQFVRHAMRRNAQTAAFFSFAGEKTKPAIFMRTSGGNRFPRPAFVFITDVDCAPKAIDLILGEFRKRFTMNLVHRILSYRSGVQGALRRWCVSVLRRFRITEIVEGVCVLHA